MHSEKNYDVVILDSGVELTHPELSDYTDIDCAYLDPETQTLQPDGMDVSGHATAIAALIKKYQPDASVLSIRIFQLVDDKPFCTEEHFLNALYYIYAHISTKVLNISLDIAEPVYIRELKDITKKLSDRGVIMVSAIDNFGGLTYPATLDWVIGVSMNHLRSLTLPLSFNHDSMINLIASANQFHVAWKNGSYKNVRGSSFSCAVVSAQVLSFMKDGHVGFHEILKCFEKKYPPIGGASKSPEKDCTVQEKPQFTIKKAALFPFNKEMHSVVRYAKELPFEIAGVFDVKQTFRVGKNTNDVLKQPLQKNYVIQNIEKINWDMFDTLVLGCVTELVKLFRRTDWIKEIVDTALAKGKNIFAFEDIRWLTEEKERVYFPIVTKENVPLNRENRLFRTAVPIIGVFGTDSQQGKFTIQMLLRREFQKLDCIIGQIGTEPNALLFGMDYVYASGYNSVIELDTTQQTLYVNDLLRRTCEKFPDIIITGTQKGLVAKKFDNMECYSQQNYAFLDGIKPDYAVLTVFYNDSSLFIQRNIDFLSSISQTKTLALVLFPVCGANEQQEASGEIRHVVSYEEYELFRDQLQKEIALPVLFLNDESVGEKLMQIILAEIS